MITVANLDTWLHGSEVGLDSTVPVLPGSLVDVPGYPDRAVFVTSTPGGGLQLEGELDIQNFQFRVRGVQGDRQAAYADAQALAADLDVRLVRGSYPTTIGGLTVTRFWRTGGPPAYLASLDRRAHFTCGYLFEAAVPAIP